MKPNMLDTNGLGKNSKNTDRVMIMKEQSSAFKAKEYEMLRAEILQYMEEYQTVRNMMYVVTATILSITSGLWKNYYLFLLPLVVILPGYIIYFKYMKSVLVASIYMQFFWRMMILAILTGGKADMINSPEIVMKSICGA